MIKKYVTWKMDGLTDANFLKNNEHILPFIYDFIVVDSSDPVNHTVTEKVHIYPDNLRDKIIYTLPTGEVVWENIEERHLRNRFLRQYPEIRSYTYGYIAAAAPKGSEPQYKGYEFWQEITY